MEVESMDIEGTQPAEPVRETSNNAETDGFANLGLGPESLRAVAELGYEAPTPIQEQTIRHLLDGRDVIAQAPTGTGKTAAYALPIVERMDEDELRPQALVVAPTRELAIQIAQAMHTLGKYHEVVTLPIYGGQAYDRQFRALARGVQVVVGTPGRLLDHLRRRTLDLSGVRTVVLDEADEMLNMGFIEDIEAILSELPAEHETALFSATLPTRVQRLAEQYLRNPVRVSVSQREAVGPLVRQVYYEVPQYHKPEALARILDLEQPESAIVFVRTRREADALGERLNGLDYPAQAIHGDLSQAQRERVLGRFRTGHTQLLVATDVAARGLDIPEVSHIINYDLPEDPEIYVHRIGRTARAGRSGVALTLVTPRERRHLKVIEALIHTRLQRLHVPTPDDVAARRRAAFREEVLEVLEAGEFGTFQALVDDLSETHDPAQVAAAAFKMAAQARGTHRTAKRRVRSEPTPAAVAGSGTRADRTPQERPERIPERPFNQSDRRPAPFSNDRPDRSADRPPRREDNRDTGEMVRLFVRIGKRDNLRPGDLVGAIANEAGVSGQAVGGIEIGDAFSFVEVPSAIAHRVLSALNGTTIRGRQPEAVIARPGSALPDRGNEREGGFDRGGPDSRSGGRVPPRDRPSGPRRRPTNDPRPRRY